jgi:DNA-binding MarR family transcriptional regulator
LKDETISSDELLRRAVMLILHIIRNLRNTTMETELNIELTFPQNIALQALVEKSPSTMSELANWLKISHGVATRTVDRLVDKGLVERRHDDVDRRVVLVSLSEDGRDYAEKLVSLHLEKLYDVFESVSEEQKRAFIDMLEQIDSLLEG